MQLHMLQGTQEKDDSWTDCAGNGYAGIVQIKFHKHRKKENLRLKNDHLNFVETWEICY